MLYVHVLLDIFGICIFIYVYMYISWLIKINILYIYGWGARQRCNTGTCISMIYYICIFICLCGDGPGSQFPGVFFGLKSSQEKRQCFLRIWWKNPFFVYKRAHKSYILEVFSASKSPWKVTKTPNRKPNIVFQPPTIVQGRTVKLPGSVEWYMQLLSP